MSSWLIGDGISFRQTWLPSDRSSWGATHRHFDGVVLFLLRHPLLSQERIFGDTPENGISLAPKTEAQHCKGAVHAALRRGRQSERKEARENLSAISTQTGVVYLRSAEVVSKRPKRTLDNPFKARTQFGSKCRDLAQAKRKNFPKFVEIGIRHLA
ncbi:hypothetical protein C8R44DRAFT_742775 [Mycena epipterygia]|nr:hypothetical protein C8R44DRAFT_742775 [Mycena epipterygia]